MHQRINLNLRVSQKQILTPGLVQMVSVLALNKLELRDMITQEVVENPLLEEIEESEDGDGLASVEDLAAMEAHAGESSDREITEASSEIHHEPPAPDRDGFEDYGTHPTEALGPHSSGPETESIEPVREKDSFEEIDFGAFFDEYLDPGYRSPASEDVEKPSFENFLATPTNLTDHLLWQLSLTAASDNVKTAAEAIIGNLDEDGFLRRVTPEGAVVSWSIEEIAENTGCALADLEEGLRIVQEFDPIGVAARDLRECLLQQLRSIGMDGSTVWEVVHDYLPLVQNRQIKDIAKALGKPVPVIEESLEFLKRLDPRPGQRYNKAEPRLIEPDVYVTKVGDEWQIILNEEDVPQLRLNLSYRKMLGRGNADKDVRNYIKDRYSSAMQLMKNIEQRKQTILKVCHAVFSRQEDFLAHGIDALKPMMIKEVAEEVGVHPSTVSRAVANKYAHTPQGVLELRYFFSEAVQGPSGHETSLLVLKRRVKKMIEDEDPTHPLTDDQITRMLQSQGIQVTRRTVAKYREDLKIPSTHQRRVKN